MLEMIKPFNFILAADSYKVNHYLELPSDVEYTYTVMVPRKPSKYADKIVAMGQNFVSHILSQVRITQDMIEDAAIETREQGYTFNRAGWERIVNELDGKLPLTVYAVEEGTVVAPQTPIVGIINSVPGFAWLPTYIETWTQCVVWKMSTVASVCRAARLTIAQYITLTGADMSMLDYKLHNFGDRGADSPEEAAVIAGIAHAALFNGSDCLRSNGYIKKLYNTTLPMTSSVEATEHSVMCANSHTAVKDDYQAAIMATDRLIEVVKNAKNGIGIPLMSVVIDTYDSRRFVKSYMGYVHKPKILNSGGKMVMRPDSGNPIVEPALVANDLEQTFGLDPVTPETSTGYKNLHPAVGVIQGDGIRVDTIGPVLKGFTDNGYSMNNLTLGMGSGTTHDGARDDFSFSMKAVATKDGYRWERLLKEPKTDIAKRSLSGLVRCITTPSGELQVVDMTSTPEEFFKPSAGWQMWYHDGVKTFSQSFEDVRARARAV